MNVSQLLAVLKGVLLNKYVIICAIIVFVYIDFVWFVARYRKKPRVVKRKSTAAAAPAPAADTQSAEGGGDAAASAG